jgi:hypothetical protein
LSPIILEKETCIKPREGVQKRLGGNHFFKLSLLGVYFAFLEQRA